MLFLIIITLFIILNLYFIFNLYLTDKNSSLKLAKNRNELKIYLYKSNPILISLPNKNIDLDIFNNLETCYKNNIHFNNLKLINKINFDYILLNSDILCNFKYSLSYYDKKQVVSFKECKNNYHIISCIDGEEFYIYLLNPKYKELRSEEALKHTEKILHN